MHSRLLLNNTNWDAESAIVMTCSFPTGSCLLTSYKLTPEGLDWGRNNKEMIPNPAGYGPQMYEKI